MLPQAVEISGNGRHLCKERGFLAVYDGKERLGRMPLDDLGVVLVAGHGVTYSNDLLAALAERCVPLVLCGRAMRPLALVWSLEGHHLFGERVRAQAAASLPLRKRLWQSLVRAKIRHQARHAALRGQPCGHLEKLAGAVRSGDSANAEAAAAKRYWPLCFGPNFRRDRDLPGVNTLLNYGYTVLRAATARAVMLAGLLPAFGLHHKSARNPMPLVDDLMEPFRPMADMLVLRLADAGQEELNPRTKELLASLPNLDIPVQGEVSTVGNCLKACAASLAETLVRGRGGLLLPDGLAPLGDKAPAPWPS